MFEQLFFVSFVYFIASLWLWTDFFFDLLDNKDGLFETIEKSKTHFARRAYLAIKMLTKLFSQSAPALSILRRDPEIKNQWLVVVDWLKLELNRNQFAISSGGNQYQNYNYSWNNSVNSAAASGGMNISNETANGHALERSPSARLTLQKASEFIPIAKPASPTVEKAPSVSPVNYPNELYSLDRHVFNSRQPFFFQN